MIRKATSSEYEAYAGLYAQADKPDPLTMVERLEWRRKQFAEIDEGGRTVFLAEAGGQVVGATQLSLDDEPGAGKISAVAVAPEWRRRGIGTRLMNTAEGAAAERGLTSVILYVRTDNAPAIAMYVGRGYERIPEAEEHWAPPDCHVMRKRLPA